MNLGLTGDGGRAQAEERQLKEIHGNGLEGVDYPPEAEGNFGGRAIVEVARLPDWLVRALGQMATASVGTL